MKAKIVALLFVIILIGGGMSVVSTSYGGDNDKMLKITKNFRFSSPIINKEGDYISLSIPGESSFLLKEGMPLMPMVTKTFTFPLGTKIIDVSYKIFSKESHIVKNKVMPAPSPVLAGHIASPKLKENEEIYASKLPFPGNWISYRTGGGLADGQHVTFLTLTIFPVQYMPAEGKLLCAKDIEISIKYKEKPMSFNDEYDLLVIAPSEFSNALQEFIDYKNSVGVRTLLKSMELIPNHGRDVQESIKYYIKDAIEQYGINAVLLVGDAKAFPVRYTHAYDGAENEFPSDLYYADIYNGDASFSSWDTNNNNIFGEYNYRGNTDNLDLYPDVYIGRWACSTPQDVAEVVNKVLTYEESTFEQPWFKKIAVCAGDTFPGDDDDTYEGEYLTARILENTSNFTQTKLWTSLGTLSRNSILDAINDGFGFVDFSGHGNPGSWATHPPDDEDTWIGITVADIPYMTNEEKLPVVILGGCSCGKFDDKRFNPCIAWKFVQHDKGGAIASFGNTALGWVYVGKGIPYGLVGFMNLHTFISYQNINGEKTFGRVWAETINDYLNTHSNMDEYDHKTIEEWEAFGDPSLVIGGRNSEGRIWISSPRNGYLYLFGQERRQTISGKTIIIGSVSIKASATLSNITVEFYVDDELKFNDSEEPYEWLWDERAAGTHTIKIVAYDGEKTMSDEITVKVFNI
ncbi:hypothetical protein B6U81_06685 [Thermoplasmatales archaeon ex4484_30]|nr:MAG: hypothetical protein B6U81_06685 [Thermoplasmatales archaeon ex4484_30]